MLSIKNSFLVLITSLSFLSAEAINENLDNKKKSYLSKNSNITYNGRVDWSDSLNPRFDWPGFSFETKFTGNYLELYFNDVGNWYNITVDGEEYPILKTELGEKTYLISDKLDNGEHSLYVQKRFETNWSSAVFKGITVDDSSTLSKPTEKKGPKIEYIGDSFVVGYGIESKSHDGDKDEYGSVEPYTFYTNVAKSWGDLLAKEFDSEYMMSAYSGKGLVRNANGSDSGKYIGNYYDYALNSPINLHQTPTKWDFDNWKADLVIINIGINDFAGETVEPADTNSFNIAYHNLLDTIRSRYNNVKIILMATNDWPNNFVKPQVRKVVNEEKEAGAKDIYLYEYDSGNDALHWHLSENDGINISKGLSNVIKDNKILDNVSIKSQKPINHTFKSFVANNKIEISYPKAGDYSLKLFGVNGKILFSQKVQVGNSRKVFINKQFTPGIYLLYIEGDNIRFQEKILVK